MENIEEQKIESFQEAFLKMPKHIQDKIIKQREAQKNKDQRAIERMEKAQLSRDMALAKKMSKASSMGREKVEVIKIMKKLADEEAGIKDFMHLKQRYKAAFYHIFMLHTFEDEDLAKYKQSCELFKLMLAEQNQAKDNEESKQIYIAQLTSLFEAADANKDSLLNQEEFKQFQLNLYEKHGMDKFDKIDLQGFSELSYQIYNAITKGVDGVSLKDVQTWQELVNEQMQCSINGYERFVADPEIKKSWLARKEKYPGNFRTGYHWSNKDFAYVSDPLEDAQETQSLDQISNRQEVEITELTTTRVFITSIIENIQKDANEVEPFIKKLENDWIVSVQLLNELTDSDWKEYNFPKGFIKLIKLHMRKVRFN